MPPDCWTDEANDMRSIHRWLADTLQTAAPASAATTAAVALCGQIEDGNGIAPLNAISHILWGEKAAQQADASVGHTVAGVALNTAAVTGWAAVYELAFGGAARQGNLLAAMTGGITVSALAYVTDYYVVPSRFTPGFEKRLSPASLLAVYATLALSLPVASLAERHLAPNSRE
jgi:hypothetical protein